MPEGNFFTNYLRDTENAISAQSKEPKLPKSAPINGKFIQ
jgi:hypothetical protein